MRGTAHSFGGSVTYADIDRLMVEHARRLPRPMAMGVRFPSVVTNTFVGPLPANGTETVVLTTGPIEPSIDNATILLAWMGNIQTGTSTTQLGWRIRRGATTAGVQVGVAVWVNTQAVGVSAVSGGFYFDIPGVVAGQQYSLTVSQTNAAAAGTWNDGALLAMVL
jgi:hypothetical protein